MQKFTSPSDPTRWLALLERLPLSRTEQELVARFQQDPGGKGFLPVAELLRSYQFTSDAIDLLVDGLKRHPDFFVARILLVRELLERGELLGAWQFLDAAPGGIQDNTLAQKLRFKLAILLADDQHARVAFDALQRLSAIDHDLRKVADLYKVSGISKARDFMMDVYKRQGIQVKLPSIDDVQPAADAAPERFTQKLLAFNIDHLASAAEAFTVASLDDIAKHMVGSAAPVAHHRPAVELDSTTLAEIYAKQGHHRKAREVYKRLLAMTPENEALKQKYAETLRLERNAPLPAEQDADVEHEQTETADRMAQLEIINRQMKFYQQLLERL